MTSSSSPASELPALIAAERRALADVLAGLPAEAWDRPTLCAGWRVREVVAHITMPFRYSTARFAMEMIRSGGRFHRMADRCARHDATASPDELTAALGDNATHPWKPPGAGLDAALTHDVIHGLDITTPLGIDLHLPEATLRTVLTTVTSPASRKHFGVDLDGIELHAEDIDWSYGTGPPVIGTAQNLALILCGRTLAAGQLRGEPGPRFTHA
jgi:uncharacterized protein (TIGR03083 family)